MDLAAAQKFVQRHHHAVLATRTAGGGIQQTPVLVGVDDEGRFVISTRETAYKTRHLRRDPRAHLCIVTDGFFGPWLYVEGDAEVISLPEAMEPLVDYYRRLSGEHEDWEEFREAMRRDHRVLIRVTATRAGPDRMG